jgi:hypothetical protein
MLRVMACLGVVCYAVDSTCHARLDSVYVFVLLSFYGVRVLVLVGTCLLYLFRLHAFSFNALNCCSVASPNLHPNSGLLRVA